MSIFFRRASLREVGQGGVESGEVLHHGTYEGGWPRNLGGPCFSSGRSGFTESRSFISKTGASAGARAGRQANWQNKRLPHGGRSLTRGTEVAAEGGEEVGELHRSFDVGELAGNSDPAEQRRLVLM